MSPTRELWITARNAMLADTTLMALIDAIYDKPPENRWQGTKAAHITRGPASGVDDSAECIPGSEITLQIDVWSRQTARSACDDVVFAVRKALHEQELPFADNALVELRVDFWQVVDDPDQLTQHGIVQVTAMVEEPEGT
jgi:hypothetical protein